jgi:signal transduction histidine kinase
LNVPVFAPVAVLVAVAAVGALLLIVRERRRQEVFARENARLLAEAQVRERERSRLADRLVTAEQDERRRLALFLHDGPVQHLAGIALMLDAASYALEEGRQEQAASILDNALGKHRETIRSLRDLSFNIEPVVLRDEGFGAAVKELANQLGIEHSLQIEVDVAPAERLAENVQAGLYQIVREALVQAVRRGPPTRISVVGRDRPDGSLELLIEDDGKGERRRAALDSIAERTSTLHGRFDVEPGREGGTAIHVVLPAPASAATDGDAD